MHEKFESKVVKRVKVEVNQRFDFALEWVIEQGSNRFLNGFLTTN